MKMQLDEKFVRQDSKTICAGHSSPCEEARAKPRQEETKIESAEGELIVREGAIRGKINANKNKQLASKNTKQHAENPYIRGIYH